MKKTLFLLYSALALALCACMGMPSAPVSASQQALNLTAQTCKSNNAAIDAADGAVKANVLKGQDARNALTGLSTIQAACVSTLAALQSAASAASGASK